MSHVQYGKQIVTGMTNLSNSGKVEMCGDSRAVFPVLPVHVALKYASLNRMRFGPGFMSFESKQYGGQRRRREPELLF